jgi:hypothetical protein
VHLRRALLLFAIVLGLAAIAAAVSRPSDDPDDGAASTSPSTAGSPTAGSGTAEAPSNGDPVRLRFAIGSGAQKLAAGQAATVLVEVHEPGQAEITGLGLTAAAEPLTPARFDVLVQSPDRYPIWFTPAGGGEAVEAGTLVVTAAQE